MTPEQIVEFRFVASRLELASMYGIGWKLSGGIDKQENGKLMLRFLKDAHDAAARAGLLEKVS